MNPFFDPPESPETVQPEKQPLRVTHPGTQEPIHRAHGGEDHSHPHMGFCGPDKRTGNAFQSNIHAQYKTTQGKHVIPQGYFGEITKREAQFPPEGEEVED